MILLVAPRTDLEYVDEEIKRVVNFLRPRVLIGVVTLAQVVDELQNYPVDIVWFSTHSTEEGIQLSDGFLTATMLAQLLKNTPPKLVFVNTCNSLSIIMEIHDAVGCMVIGTICDVPDREAFVTGSSLARALGQGMDPAEAYNISRPSQNRKYIMLNGAIRMNGEKESDDTNQLLMLIIKRQDEFEKSLKSQMLTLADQMDTHYQRRLTVKQGMFLIAGYITFIIGSFFMSHQLPRSLGVDGLESTIIMILLQFIAGGMFVWGIWFSYEKIKRRENQEG